MFSTENGIGSTVQQETGTQTSVSVQSSVTLSTKAPCFSGNLFYLLKSTFNPIHILYCSVTEL